MDEIKLRTFQQLIPLGSVFNRHNLYKWLSFRSPATFREGDANMSSVWLCSRNVAISNAAVFMAALGVFGTSSAWPDLIVASLTAALALHGG
jgi:Co/Zn/Cd efflux system component